MQASMTRPRSSTPEQSSRTSIDLGRHRTRHKWLKHRDRCRRRTIRRAQWPPRRRCSPRQPQEPGTHHLQNAPDHQLLTHAAFTAEANGSGYVPKVPVTSQLKTSPGLVLPPKVSTLAGAGSKSSPKCNVSCNSVVDFSTCQACGEGATQSGGTGVTFQGVPHGNNNYSVTKSDLRELVLHGREVMEVSEHFSCTDKRDTVSRFPWVTSRPPARC